LPPNADAALERVAPTAGESPRASLEGGR